MILDLEQWVWNQEIAPILHEHRYGDGAGTAALDQTSVEPTKTFLLQL